LSENGGEAVQSTKLDDVVNGDEEGGGLIQETEDEVTGSGMDPNPNLLTLTF